MNSHIQLHRCTTLGRLYFVYICEDRRPQNTFSKNNAPCVLPPWCWHVISLKVVVWSEFVSLVSSILPPLHRFRAATYHQQLHTHHITLPYRKTANFHKVLMQIRCSLVKLSRPIRTGSIFSPGNGLNYANVNKRLLPINALWSASLFMLQFPYSLENLCRYFEKYGHTICTASRFPY